MNLPTDAELRHCAGEVVRLFASTSTHFEVDQANQVKFQAAFPLAMYALNHVHAALILARERREYLAVANVRVAYEHAVTAQWVLFTPGAEEQLVGSVNRHNHLVVQSLKNQVDLPEELGFGFGADSDPRMPSFKDRCSALDGGTGSLLFYYQVLSEAIHPSTATLLQHLNLDASGAISGVNFGTAQPPPPDTWLVCALASLSSAAAIEVHRRGQPRMHRLLVLAERYGVPLDLRGDPESTAP